MEKTMVFQILTRYGDRKQNLGGKRKIRETWCITLDKAFGTK